MSGDFILDSNIIINIFRKDLQTIEYVTQLKNIYVPVIALGELYFGARKSNKTKERLLEIEGLVERVILLDVTEKTAFYYGMIKNDLRSKGRPIPENDIWIAALALESELPLLTNDKHFQEVIGIEVHSIYEK
jgi:tRNA(fMet)-specific endonuclease VapC